jgi:hypothetical protein
MPGPPFSLANLQDVAAVLYGRQWQAAMARDLSLPVRSITGWCNGEPLPDLRRRLADLCRKHDPYDPNMERMARKLESLGPPE